MHCQGAQLNTGHKGSCVVASYKIEFCKKIFASVLQTYKKGKYTVHSGFEGCWQIMEEISVHRADRF